MPQSCSFKTLILVVLAFFSLSISFSQDPGTVKFEWATCPKCPIPKADPADIKRINMLLGYLTVPENRSIKDGRTIRLGVSILKSTDPKTTKAPLIVLHGGPGGKIVGFYSPQYEKLRKDRDVVFIDQRGAGSSEPAFSPEMNQQLLNLFAQDLSPTQELEQRVSIAAKAKEKLIQKGIDLSVYNSAAIAADIRDLGKALGYTSWNLWGSSYGTRVALTMMRDYPEGIRSVILESPLPPNVPYFQNITATFKRSLDKLFDRCSQDAGCRLNYPDLKNDFYAAIESLDKQPMVVHMADKTKFPAGEFIINSQDMLLAFQQAMYSQDIYPILPLLIEQIKNRNEAALKNFVTAMSNGIFRLDYGLYYTVICKECMPFNDLKVFDSSSSGFWKGLSFYRDEFDICNLWNTAAPNQIDSAAVASNIPALILSGDMDPIAAASNGEIAHRTLGSSFLYTFENTGHFASGNPHAMDLIQKFLNDPDKEPDAAHFVKAAPIPFAGNVHVHNGIISLAPKLQINKANWVYTGWLVVIGLCLLSGLFIAGRKYLTNKKYKWTPLEKSFYILSIAGSIGGLYFCIRLIQVIFKTAASNRMVLGFGLPGQYATVLWVPYFIVLCYAIQLLLLVWERKNKNAIKYYRTFLLLQIPFLFFVFYFWLFY
ncbi:alpha/beta fold hydrolase [Niastella populi]|nr:alpha/beta fold hydrolase [Niastella populi]